MTDKKDPYFTFYVCDYFETGCGRTIFIMIDCSWDKHKIRENFRTFLGHSHYYGGIDELSEEVFMERYGDYLSDKIKKFLEEKDTSFFTYQQKLHFNYYNWLQKMRNFPSSYQSIIPKISPHKDT